MCLAVGACSLDGLLSVNARSKGRAGLLRIALLLRYNQLAALTRCPSHPPSSRARI